MQRLVLILLLLWSATALRPALQSSRSRSRSCLLGSGGPAEQQQQQDDVLAAPIEAAKLAGQRLGRAMSGNPVSRVFINTYNFWYWLPKRNMPYDMPWQLFKNSTVEWIAWYQFPHNLPPYRYLPVDRDGPFGGYRDDFFCYGLPGNTLPLGNWDPAGFQLAHKKVVLKYRESELKHGRLAMLAALGFPLAESFQPLYPDVGGMSITHMTQLSQLGADGGVLSGLFALLDQAGFGSAIRDAIGWFPFDYTCIVLFLASFEVFALRKNWTRSTEYRHQFDHNIGIGNLKDEYENGAYGFDPLHLRPKDAKLRREVEEIELNHGRLACVAIIGMIGQEYLTGLPILTSLRLWLGDSSSSSSSASISLDGLSDLFNSASAALQRLQTEGLVE